MTTSEIERLVTATLQAHAEDAMSRTDTQTQLETLRRESARQPRRRAGWAAGGLVAAAAAVAIVVWWQATPDAADVEPAPPVDVPTQGVDVATAFVEAWGDFDRPLAASFIADGARLQIGPPPVTPGSWLVENRWDQATGFTMQLDSCSRTSGSGDTMLVTCTFSFHQLGSERLGRGPYVNNVFRVNVEDGKVVDATKLIAFDSSGYRDEMVTPFFRWLDAEHADQTVLAAYDDPASTEAEIDASLQLWEQRVQGYVDAVRAGTAE
jgi:hypothetical protein